VQRRPIAPRRDWQAKVEALGLVWHTAGGQPYWNEGAYYSFTLREVEEIEAATAALYDLMLKAGQAVIDRGLWARCGIPIWCAPLIAAAWEAEPACLNHGRFDLAYDGSGPPKLLEFNCDTPTALFEAAVVQWLWKEEVKPRADQFNSLHERLVAKWADIRPYLPPLVHFTHMADPAGEDVVTVAYLRDAAREAGLQSEGILIQDIGWDGRRFLDLENRPIGALFHLYPWEWLVREEFGRNIASAEPMLWIEPIWKMMLSNKAILPLLWELNPGHPYLLPASFEPLRGDQVKKPILGREGANISVIRGGRTVAETRGDYGEEGYVYQQYAPLPDFGGQRPVVGSWVVDGEPAGMGIREDGLITGNLARFVPHAIEG
jgi:glutathionylspermidine synthase